MSRTLVTIMLSVVLISSGYSQMPNTIEKMQELIRTISAKEGAAIATQFPEAEVVGLLETMPEYKELATLSASNWRDALSSLSTVAPDKQSRVILLHSFESLSPESYLAFADKSLDLVAVKQIEKNEFLNIVLMSPTKKRWFLSYNYQNPGVINFLNRVRSQFASEPNIPALADFILSGKARTRDEILRKENRYFAAQSIDLLPGSTMPTPSQKTTVRQGESATTPKSEASPASIVAAKQSASSFPIVPVAILGLGIIGVIVVLLRRKSP